MLQKTGKWVEKDRQYLWHAMSGYDPESSHLTIASAEGAWVTDIEGNKYLDGMSGLWCVNAGYGREELARAAYDQLNTLPFYPLTKSHVPAIELGEKLNEWLDDEYVFFFSNSGSEANEVAFKVARQYHEQNGEPGRWKFISRYRSYHGNTLGTLAATGQAARKYRYEPLTPGFVHVPPPDSYRGHLNVEDPEECARLYAEEIERAIMWEMPETVAGVIMEPIITGGGILIPPESYMGKVEEICEKHGVLLISDEVICGFGRTGKKFAHQHYGVKPDIVSMAKGITSAYFPLSATAVKRELYESFANAGEYDRFRHVNTFGGHPAGCAVAIKNLEIMEEEKLPERSAEKGKKLLEKLSAELGSHPNVGDVRGRGLLIGIEFVEDKETKTPAPDMATKVLAGCQSRGLIVGKNADTVAGFNNVVSLSPPLNITDEDLSFVVETMKEVLGF
ncbi:MAG: aspartate aminotransferase family protein [Rubrobacter sp.]|nr:aspartate aminotransferase family protein [Rubrobacter sp.]